MKKNLCLFFALAIAQIGNAQPYAVTFRVDMSNNPPITGERVTVAGDFAATATPPSANWTQGILQLTDADNDFVYEGMFQLAAGSIQYKFAKTDASGSNVNLENQPNRVAIVSNNTVLPIYCFGLTNSGSCVGAPDTAEVIIKIDFTRQFNAVGSPRNGLVSIVLNFALPNAAPAWTPNEILMYPDSNMHYTTGVLRIPQGTYEYRAVYGDSLNNQEWLAGPCAVANGSRILVVPGTSSGQINPIQQIEGPFCFNSCAPCPMFSPPHNGRFRLFVGDRPPGCSYFINGSFNAAAFAPNTDIELTAEVNTGFFSKEIMLYPGEYQYLYREFDGTKTTETFTTTCSSSNIVGSPVNYRRYFTMPTGTNTYLLDNDVYGVCWFEATESEKANAAFFSIAPNPVSSVATVSFSNKTNSEFNLTITDIAGKIVRSTTDLSGNATTLDRGALNTGIYFITLTTIDGARFTQKLVIQ